MLIHDRVLICGTDLTNAARGAVGVAASLASAMAARLELVHVVESVHPSPDDELRTRRATTALADLAGTVAAAHGIGVSSRVMSGAPAARLAEAAAAAQAELVVVASAPTPSIFDARGTAERLVQSVRAPLLLVRDAARFRTWLGGGRLAIAALVSGDAASEHVIDWLRRLRRVGVCDVSVLQAYYVDDEARRYGLGARPLVVADPEIEGLLRRDLQRRVGELGGQGTIAVHPVLALGRQADHLLDHPAARDAGLVVVGNHRTHGVSRWASVAAGVVHLAEPSVLVVPTDAPATTEPAWPTFHRILVATDFSSFAAAAIRHAYGLAAGGGGDVILVHATAPRTARTTVASELAALQALIPASPPDGVLSQVEVAVDHDAADAIVHAAARLGADCIVIASHGRGGVRRALLGSVAQAVVQRSQCPVLVVRPPADS